MLEIAQNALPGLADELWDCMGMYIEGETTASLDSESITEESPQSPRQHRPRILGSSRGFGFADVLHRSDRARSQVLK